MHPGFENFGISYVTGVQTANLKSSPPDEIFVVNTIPNNLSFQELWDGKTTKDWRDAYKSTFPGKGWIIKDSKLMA